MRDRSAKTRADEDMNRGSMCLCISSEREHQESRTQYRERTATERALHQKRCLDKIANGDWSGFGEHLSTMKRPDKISMKIDAGLGCGLLIEFGDGRLRRLIAIKLYTNSHVEWRQKTA
ncbi:hypothetical protein Tco_0566369 [Tanacetum coccineum]